MNHLFGASMSNCVFSCLVRHSRVCNVKKKKEDEMLHFVSTHKKEDKNDVEDEIRKYIFLLNKQKHPLEYTRINKE